MVLESTATRIQPMCPIEEKAINVRACVWFIPPKPPTRLEIHEIITRKELEEDGRALRRITIGAIFCHERIKKRLTHEEVAMTFGTH